MVDNEELTMTNLRTAQGAFLRILGIVAARRSREQERVTQEQKKREESRAYREKERAFLAEIKAQRKKRCEQELQERRERYKFLVKTLNDPNVLLQLRNDHRSKYWEMVNEFVWKVMRLIKPQVSNALDLDDIVQVIMEKLLLKLHLFAGRATFTTFVYSFVKLEVIEYQRKVLSHLEQETSLDGVEDPYEVPLADLLPGDSLGAEADYFGNGAVLIEVLSEIVGKYTDRSHDPKQITHILDLALIKGYTVDEIASELCLNYHAVYMALKRARLAIKTKLIQVEY